ncbi:MAG TPA: AIR synthase-related protein, partial [Nitrososphaerales archaeon]|nr:AIR synthase-related protein [Nitrososphaerales archaeon]
MSHQGKESPAFLEKAVYAHLGAKSEDVVVGPGVGLDNGVFRTGKRSVMIATADPISAIPALGMETSAWLSVHLVASDFTASGVDPGQAIFTYNFPPEMTRAQKAEYVRSIGDACGELGVAILAGHTGTYPGGGFTVIGAGVMLAASEEGRYVTPAMASEGDAILMTKHAGIESALTLATSFPEFLGGKIGTKAVRKASSAVSLCTTVEDARAARRAGLGKGLVSSMHDATDGGVIGALEEMSVASGKSFAVDPLKIPVAEECRAICEAFGIDPLRTMGEGALLIT